MTALRYLAVAVMLGGILAVVNAQQPGRRPGGTGGGTPGAGGGGGATGPIDRLKNKSVAEDLKISQDQLEKLKALSEDMPARVQAAIQAETYRQLGEVLSPDQVKRLKQIDIQASGLRAFNNAEVAATLKLTDDQKAQITKLRDETATASREAFSGLFGGGQRPTEDKIAEARKKAQSAISDGMAKAQAILSSEQQAIWKSLLGEPFDTSTLAPATGFGTGTGGRPGFPGGGTRPGAPGANPRPQPKD